MKKIIVKIYLLTILTLIVCSTHIEANTTGFIWGDKDLGLTNKYEATGPGNATGPSHSYHQYIIDGVGNAYCIEAGVLYHAGVNYTKQDEPIYDARFSWLIYNVPDMQDRQGAIWMLAGQSLGNGSTITAGDTAYLQQLIDTAGEEVAKKPANATVETSGGFTYDRSSNTYVSANIHVENGGGNTLGNAPYGTYITGEGNDFQIVVPAQNVTEDIDIVFNVAGSGSGWDYHAADVWWDGTNQKVITGSRDPISGNGTSVSMHLEAVGDLRIEKYDEHGKVINGAQFRVTGPGVDEIITTGQPSKKYGNDAEDGVAKLLEIHVDDYIITEVYVPGNLSIGLNTQNISYHVNSGYTSTITFNARNDYKRGKTQLDKYDMDFNKDPKGDCVLEGAVYGVFADEEIIEGSDPSYTSLFDKDEKIIEVKTDKTGKTPVVKDVYSKKQGKMLDGLPVGKYYWKELEPSKGFNINPDIVHFEIINDGTDIFTDDLGKIDATQGEDEIKGRGIILKYDNDNSNIENENDTEKSPAEGAILRIRLKSAIGTDEEARNTYTAIVDDKGGCEFKDPEYLALHPNKIYTIPYGVYILDEIQASNKGTHTYFYINPTEINIDENHKIERKIVSDEPVPMWLKLIKKDQDTKEEVHIAGAQYKIWDCQSNSFVSQMVSPSGEYTEVFETNDEGYFFTHQQLYAGDYIIYEITPPKGYFLDEKYRLPKEESDWGDENKGGKKVHIDKEAMGMIESATPGSTKKELIYPVEIYNKPLTVKLDVKKRADKIVGSTTEVVSYKEVGDDTKELDKYKATYDEVGLEGVTYEIYAAENIEYPDGRGSYYHKDQLVDTITTDSEGYAISKELYPGEYRIVETVTPEGYLKDKNIPNVKLTNENPLERVKTFVKELSDKRQKLGLKFKKNFEEVNYTIGEKVEQRAVFGIYAAERILNYKGNTVIPKDSLVDLVEINGSTDVISDRDLPQGKYYVKELYTSAPYTTNSKITEFELKYNDNSEQEYVVVEGEEYKNKPETGSFVLVKLSSSIGSEGNILMNGSEIVVSDLDALQQKVIKDITGLNDDQIIDYLNKNEMYFLPGAKFRIYADKECTEGKEVRIKDKETGEYKILEIVTNEIGLIRVKGIPVGEYYIKEIKAPDGYPLPDDEKKLISKIVVNDEGLPGENIVYQTIVNDSSKGKLIQKEDIFTSEAIPECYFEIRDENDTVLAYLKTELDEKGNAVGYIPLDIFEDGKTYTYTETKAPDIYEIDTTPHEFTAKFDKEGNWITEISKVSNIRKTRKVIVRKLDAKTNEPLQGCVFTIALIDPKTGKQSIDPKTGKPIYLVENAVTGENGEYEIEKAPMGTYKFIEIKAPEGYELDEDLTGYTFTINNDSPETIIFEVTNTGDIQVIVLSVVAIISVLGIIITLKRKLVK